MQSRKQQQIPRPAAQEIAGGRESLPQENGNRLSQTRDWAISLGSDDGGTMQGGLELDGEWFGDADPSVIIQAKVSNH